MNATADQLTLVPTGPGSPRPIPKANLTYQWGQFFPDGQRLLVWANETGRAARLYVQGLDDPKPRPVTPEGFGFSSGGGTILSPDGRTAVVRGPDGRIYLSDSSGEGEPKLLTGARPDEVSWGWTADGKSVYIGRIAMPARVEICDVATGERHLWKEIVPPDPAGVLAVGPIYIAPDGKSYVYSYRRQLDDLFLVSGLE